MIQEVSTFIFTTKEEALALANNMQGFKPAEKPVGYLVKPAEVAI